MAELKAQFNYDGRLTLEENLPLDSPLVVYVEPSSFCNLECTFCPCKGCKHNEFSEKDYLDEKAEMIYEKMFNKLQ